MKIKTFFRKENKEIVTNEVDTKIEYPIGKYKIILDHNHNIDNYQAEYPLYDRFLPHFCSLLDGLIIDIGANIGDTSIAIFSQNDNCFIAGVEPDGDFFAEYVENIKLNNLENRFLGIQKFVSTKNGSFVIEKDETASTGSISLSSSESDAANTINFDGLSTVISGKTSKAFDLLKIDTDGFDWDIINSFCATESNYLKNPRFVFFEMQTFLNNDETKTLQRDEMKNNYTDAIKKLQQKDYTHYSLFDNFGTFVMTTNNIDEIIAMNEYVIRSQVHNKHSTIYYFDVLAYQEKEQDFVKNSISNFY